LPKISRQKSITFLFFDRSILHFDINFLYPSRCPLLSNLKKVKYVGALNPYFKQQTAYNFCRLYLWRTRLTHFEVAYGFDPYCPKKTRDRMNDVKAHIYANEAYKDMRREFLLFLRRSSHSTLAIYIDDNRLSGTFIDDPKIFWRIPRPASFRNIKLLVFRVKDLNSLSGVDYNQSIYHCNSAIALRAVTQQSLSLHHHSVWLQLSYEYAFFSHCDCVLVESEWSGTETIVPKSWWELAPRLLLQTSQRLEGNIGNFRFMIVGNATDGYQGIEREMEPRLNEREDNRWFYKMLSHRECIQELCSRSHGY
jgi:hypothetical protein